MIKSSYMGSFLCKGKFLIVSLMVLAASMLAFTNHASAASGYVNIKFGDWRCSQGGKVSFINGASVTPSGYTVYAVGGNTANMLVWFNTSNSVTATLTCLKPGPWYAPWLSTQYYVNVYGQGFWPTTPGQTFNL